MITKQHRPFFSIIIPVYNSIDYIGRCIDSIIEQSFQDFEIIIVDDGSSDGSSEICKNYAKNDNRIIYLYESNSGVSAARNLGLSHSKGEWVTFIDSDDYILEYHFYEVHKTLCENNNIELLMITQQVESNIIQQKFDIKCINGVIPQLYNNLRSQVWNYFFYNRIIEKFNIRFDHKFKYAEDVLFLCQYLSHVEKISVVDSRSYIYNNTNISATSNINQSNNEDHLIVAYYIYSMTGSNHLVKEKFTYDLISRYIYLLCKNKKLSLFDKIAVFNSKHNLIAQMLKSYNSEVSVGRRIAHRLPILLFLKYLL